MRVCEFEDGAEVDVVLLLRALHVRTAGEDGEVLELRLADRTGQLTAVVRSDAGRLASLLAPGMPVRVAGRCARDGRSAVRIEAAAVAVADPAAVDLADLLDGPPRSAEQMEQDLRELVATIRQPHLHALLERLLGASSALWPRFRDAPAAKRLHQAYRHGLLEHSLSVAQAVSAISATFGGIDRDVAITGALLHDIGKLDAYCPDPLAIDLTDAGRLQGEIALGYFRVRQEIEGIDGFPPGIAQAVVHIILSHHGALEFGSPVVPCTREATLVHFVDNLGGRLGSFDRLEKELPAGAAWSAYDRVLGAGAYFGAPGDVAPASAPARRAA